LTGLTDTNKRAVLPTRPDLKFGDLVAVRVTDASQNTLFTEPLEKLNVLDFWHKYRAPTLKTARML